MKRKRKLMILSGLLIFCIAGAVIISRIDFEEKMAGTETVIVDVDSDDINYLAWNYEDDEVVFVKNDGVWSLESDENMPADQELLNEIAENLSDITSDKKVEEVQSLGVYGLSDPAYNITIKTGDAEYNISIGDETFSDGEVYISNGDEYVYLTDASLIDDISYTLLDCVEKEEIPEMESISELTVKNENTEDIIYKENSGYCYSDAYTYYLLEDGQYRNLDNDNTETLFTALSELAWESCVDYYAEDSELSAYGLNDPAAEVSITYKPVESDDEEETEGSSEERDTDNEESEMTFEYQIGTADNGYYAKLKESNIVYSVSSEVYDAAVEASYEELKPDEVILLDWDTLDRVEIELDGNVYTIKIQKGEDDNIYTFGDAEIEFDDVLDQLSAVTIAEEGEEEDIPDTDPVLENNKAELVFTFHRSTENYSSVEIGFYQYNGTYCISSLNGEELNYTDRSSIVDLKEAVNSIILDSTSN